MNNYYYCNYLKTKQSKFSATQKQPMALKMNVIGLFFIIF